MNVHDRFEISIDIPKKLIISELEKAIDKAVAEEEMEINGFQIRLKRIDDALLSGKDKTIFTKIPLEIILKKPEGLFTIEGRGALILELRTDFDINTAFNLLTSSSLDSYKWLEKPKVKMGVLSIPVESLIDLVIKKTDDKLFKKIDRTIAQNVKLRSILKEELDKLSQGIPVNDNPPVYLDVDVLNIAALPLNESTDFINLKIYPVLAINLIDIKPEVGDKFPEFKWYDDKNGFTTQSVFIRQSFNTIEKAILEYINDMEVGGKKLRADRVVISKKDRLEINIHLLVPTDAMVTVTGNLHYNPDDSMIYFRDSDINVKAKNILFRLSSPIIENMIRSKMESFFPYNVSAALENMYNQSLTKIPESDLYNIDVKSDDLSLDELEVNENNISASISALNPKIYLKVKDFSALMNV